MTKRRGEKTPCKRGKTRVVEQPVRETGSRAIRRLPAGYPILLESIKARIRTAKIKASLSVNRELILLYWSIGRDIVSRQQDGGWGKSIVERLADDLQAEFPGMAGFSPRNIWLMRAFFTAWRDETRSLKRAVAEAESQAFLQQPVAEMRVSEPPQAVADIPWGHNIALIERLKDPAERLWYARQTAANGWSRSMLVHLIESDLYSRQGKAITNFKATLPAPQSDLAAELIKDPYNFDFLSLRTDAAERELERGLLDHIRRFLLELGAGFAFVGQQVSLEVDGEDFSIDLLFYHLRLRCFIVIDLKARAFKPEYAGKMNFYLSAVDDLLRHPDDKPSIGLVLCKSRSRTVAEYALRDLAKPVGVTRYATRLVESLPPRLRVALPSVKQLETELKKAANRGEGQPK